MKLTEIYRAYNLTGWVLQAAIRGCAGTSAESDEGAV